MLQNEILFENNMCIVSGFQAQLHEAPAQDRTNQRKVVCGLRFTGEERQHSITLKWVLWLFLGWMRKGQ